MSKERKELQICMAGYAVFAVMLLWFSVRSQSQIYRLRESDVVTREMYETLFAATSTLAFQLLPIVAAFMLLSAFVIWRCQRRLP